MPARWIAKTAMARKNRVPIMSLYYHRVADHTLNDWTITTEAFREQIEWLERNFDLISMREAQRRIREGNSRPAVCLTFDDGYAENCEFAMPLLIQKNIPCTYFVSSDFVRGNKPFPHDLANGTTLPPNTPGQLRSMHQAGISIAAHTRTHVDLGQVTSDQELYEEVVGSRLDLEDMIGVEVKYFAFPFGLHSNLNSAATQLAANNQFDGVCSAYGGYNTPGDDEFHIKRFHGDPSLIRIKNWLTFAPHQYFRS
jgi:peptidoglycan/xylan/chitin deacetylase (PgdA/CDA1 family)